MYRILVVIFIIDVRVHLSFLSEYCRDFVNTVQFNIYCRYLKEFEFKFGNVYKFSSKYNFK